MSIVVEVVVGVVVIAAAALLGYRLGTRSRRVVAGEPIGAPPPTVVPEAAGGGVEAPLVAAADGPEPGAIEMGLADLRLGVVVVGADGDEVYRNNRAQEYATGRHGDALVEAALERVVGGALVGLSLEESVEVYGPPARSLLVQASPTYAGGEPAGAVGVIEDVTEARHNLRVRSDFVANVSHELRTPVGAMSVLAETIAGADDPDVVARLSKRMQREASRLADTIEDLLALSRLESGPVSDPETIDLVSVATMAIDRTAEAASQRQVDVAVTEDSDGPALVDGDQGQLVSMVANLIDNAIKYSDPGGVVEVRIELAAKTVELSVHDDGIGIPERDLERVFERFYRVDSGRSRDTGGTGLGLSIVRHAALNHRGTVEVESMEGQGSTFTVRLPSSPAQLQLGGPVAPNDADEEANR